MSKSHEPYAQWKFIRMCAIDLDIGAGEVYIAGAYFFLRKISLQRQQKHQQQ